MAIGRWPGPSGANPGSSSHADWARGKADVLYVANVFEVMQEVNALLGAAKEEKLAAAIDGPRFSFLNQ